MQVLQTAPPRVFISYSHDSVAHEDRVLALADRLRADGIDAMIDQYVQSPPQGWPIWCKSEIRKSDFVLLVCTETYLRRVDGEEEPGVGHGVLWEGRLIKQHLYDTGSVSSKFVPVLFADGSDDHVPTPVRGASIYRIETAEGYESLYRLLTNQPRVRKPEIGKLLRLPERQRANEAVPQAAEMRLRTEEARREKERQWAQAAQQHEREKPAALAAQRTEAAHEAEAEKERPGAQAVGQAADRSRADLAVFRDAPFAPELVVIPAGEFWMGSPEDEKERSEDEGPRHKVRIGRRFAIGRYPLTFAEYDRFCEAKRRKNPDDGGWGRSRRPVGARPVIMVSWEDAQAYIAWLSQETGTAYRLPSEAEWEYACRAGTTTRYSFGDKMTLENVALTSIGPSEVGGCPPNRWGLYDMHGNVWEYVEDDWHEDYRGAPDDGSAWKDKGADLASRCHVCRGGSFFDVPWSLRSASRSSDEPGRALVRGFRVARTLG